VLIDEVQDFPMKGLAQVVKEWTGGHSAHIMLFGDFAHQAIYDASTRQRDQVTAAFPGMASFALSLNCRNTRMIAKQIELVAGTYGGRISERQPEGHTVEYFYHSGDDEQIAHLEQVGMTLRRQGYKPEDIIILSPGRFETGPLSRLSRLANWPVNDFEKAGPQEIARSTIHAFKGMERSVVILADIDTRDAAEADNLLYVGMSRARTRLFLLCSKATQGLINERIISNLNRSSNGNR
jgi:superfamily I DNA/RNA helicase